MKKYLIPIGYSLGIILIGTLISSILYYFNITTDKLNKIFLYSISILSIFIGSLKLGKNLIYYLVLLVFSLLGGILGKNMNEEADIS